MKAVKEEKENEPSGMLHQEQLLLSVYKHGSLTSRFHLRFGEGDDSHNVLWRGEAFIGLFVEPSLASDARQLVVRAREVLAESLPQVTLAEARLRPEDSADFLRQLLSGDKAGAPEDCAGSPCSVSVALGEPSGLAWRGVFSAEGLQSLPAEVYAVLEGCCGLAIRIAAAAAKKNQAVADEGAVGRNQEESDNKSTSGSKPWWRFW